MKSLTVKEYSAIWSQFDLHSPYDIPVVKRQKIEVKDVIGFNYCMSAGEMEKGEEPTIHFFLDDHEFERLWNNPNRYRELLGRFNGMFTPDFSLYNDFPFCVQIFNTFRNRFCGALWQSWGLKVVPTVGWGDEDSFDFCFDGIEEGSDVALSTRGVMREGEKTRAAFMAGYNELLARVQPETIYLYGSDPKRLGLEGNIVHFPYKEHF